MFLYSAWGRKLVGVEPYGPVTPLEPPAHMEGRSVPPDMMGANVIAPPPAPEPKVEYIEVNKGGSRMTPVFTLALGALAGVFGHKFYQEFTIPK